MVSGPSRALASTSAAVHSRAGSVGKPVRYEPRVANSSDALTSNDSSKASPVAWLVVPGVPAALHSHGRLIDRSADG